MSFRNYTAVSFDPQKNFIDTCKFSRLRTFSFQIPREETMTMTTKLTFAAAAFIAAAAIFFLSNDLRASLPEPVAVTETATVPMPDKTMKRFRSEAELKEHFRKMAERDADARRERSASNAMPLATAESTAPAAKMSAESKSKDDESGITNNQHAGVDEGGIVKVHGQNLVILRRGRLFTVRVGDSTLEPISSVNAYAPDVDPRNDWYDEMLVSGNTIVVIGYSYGRGGTEINLFDIDRSGGLKYRSTYHLRSNDYYSSRNYASRLIGDKLVFYTPTYIGYHGDPLQRFPAVRRWKKGVADSEFKRIVPAESVHYIDSDLREPSPTTALHTVTVCDLSRSEMDCRGTSILGSPGRIFYVSPTSVYVWTTEWNRRGNASGVASMLYSMPLDGNSPRALGVTGSPVDQFSFLETDDHHLNVLVRSAGQGEQMWGSERTSGDTALLRAPLAMFSDGSVTAGRENYQSLPNPDGYTMQNRFVGNYVLYGSGNSWGRPQNVRGANMYAVNWRTRGVTGLYLEHSVDRIEQLGNNAVVVGSNGSDLHFSPIDLRMMPSQRTSFVRKNASQGETRSHGFFYKQDGDSSGILGLPIAREGRAGYRQLREGSAAVIFLRNQDLKFEPVGELASGETNVNDGCKASCVDWYGNARPIFLRGRIFALMGYELVEGRFDNRQIREVRRVNYSPNARNVGRFEID